MMMRSIVLFAAPLPACVDSPDETVAADEASLCTDDGSDPMSADACEWLGGIVRLDIGDGQVTCERDEWEVGRVALGIEGGVCCLPP